MPTPLDRRLRAHAVRAASCVLAAAAAFVITPSSGLAQGGAGRDTVQLDTTLYLLDPIVVTATRSPKRAFVTPAPVAVIDSARLAQTRPNTVAELFRELPGVDVTGVGVQQARPIIRGQRGQRILLLQDGIRLNNSRRQQDFGEVPALVDVSNIERVEVVRGPASVLYGTDAIGGVVNVITRRPERDGLHGTLGYRFGEAEEQHKGSALLFGRFGRLDLMLSATARDAGSYTAPEGSFGNITLADETTVHRTGVQDRSLQARVGYELSDRHRVFLRAERYDAEDAGFGFVDPADYAPSQPLVDITYPDQRFTKLTAGYAASGLGSVLADGVDVMVYGQDNERNLNFDLFQSFGPRAPPGAGVSVKTFNFTDMRTVGMRAEARKLVAEGLLLTYGIDGFRDRSENTDSSVTTVVGFGPPQTEVTNTPVVPNASYRSIGAFVQGELSLGRRTTVIAGGRVQDVHAQTRATPGLDEPVEAKGNSQVVGAANVIHNLTGNIALVGSVGRAFRSPNLIEWFFEGVTPEGSGYQVRNADLEPETSVNVDLGARFRTSRLYLEGFVFRNEIRNGIRIEATGTQVNGLPAFRNVNIDELRYEGVELSGELSVLPQLALLSSYTYIDAKDERESESAYGDSYSSKLTSALRYQSNRFWAEYHVRHNGERKDVVIGENPLGDVLPSFTVHGVRGGVKVFQRGDQVHRLGISIENLSNELYAEFSNATFFRPEPRRNVTLTWQVSF